MGVSPSGDKFYRAEKLNFSCKLFSIELSTECFSASPLTWVTIDNVNPNANKLLVRGQQGAAAQVKMLQHLATQIIVRIVIPEMSGRLRQQTNPPHH